MKNIKLILTASLFVMAFGLQLQAHEAQVTLHVVDENGLPVPKAKAVMQLTVATTGGLGNEKVVNVEGFTDTNGICVLTGKGDDGYVTAAVLKEGYYGASGYRIELTNSVLGRWQPWNPTLEVVLQKKGVQVPVYARLVHETKIPVEGQSLGFDLTTGDWVAPYGKGSTADFVFKLERKPEPEVPAREIPPFDVTLTVSFSNDGDGIQSVFAPVRSHSVLRLSRHAPTDGYEPMLVKHQYKERGQPEYTDLRDDQNYFFRVRTKKDAQGNIVSALYGKIYGNFKGGIAGKLTFDYYLNPKPNDTGMEFDLKQNLFRNLPPLERVSQP